jgi:hypothetical protein
VVDIIQFYRDEDLPLQEIQLFQFLEMLNSKVGETLKPFMVLDSLVFDDRGLNSSELTICKNLLEQNALLDSWLNDIKIVNRLNLLSFDNVALSVTLCKDLNRIVNKVNTEGYQPKRIPNLLPGLSMLVPIVNELLQLHRDSADIPIIFD